MARRWRVRNSSRSRRSGEIQARRDLPASSAAILEIAGHDVDTVIGEGLTGALDPEAVAAATAAGRILISLDRGLGDIRRYPLAATRAS